MTFRKRLQYFLVKRLNISNKNALKLKKFSQDNNIDLCLETSALLNTKINTIFEEATDLILNIGK